MTLPRDRYTQEVDPSKGNVEAQLRDMRSRHETVGNLALAPDTIAAMYDGDRAKRAFKRVAPAGTGQVQRVSLAPRLFSFERGRRNASKAGRRRGNALANYVPQETPQSVPVMAAPSSSSARRARGRAHSNVRDVLTPAPRPSYVRQEAESRERTRQLRILMETGVLDEGEVPTVELGPTARLKGSQVRVSGVDKKVAGRAEAYEAEQAAQTARRRKDELALEPRPS